MGRLPLSALKPGQILAEEVRDRNGRLLLDAGVELQERHLRIFKIWGVLAVAVQDPEDNEADDDSGDVAPELLAAATAYQRARFAHNDPNHELMRELLDLCIERTVRLCMLRGVSPAMLSGRTLGLETSGQQGDERAGGAAEPGFDPERLIREELTMGTLPMVFHKLVEVVNDPRSSALDAAEVIENDPELAGRLLKIVNSSFYAMRSRVDSVSRAVAIIGGNQLLSLAVGLSVVTAFRGIPTEMVDMESFWRHSVACGIAARLMAGYHKSPNTERFFVSGLLHDIGRLALFAEKPEVARRLMERARAGGRLLVEQEVRDLGFSHCRLGGLLLETWKLPLSLESNVSSHHGYSKAKHRQEAALMHVADLLVNALELGTSGERYVPRLEAGAWELLDLSPAMVRQVAEQLTMQLDDILRFFTDG